MDVLGMDLGFWEKMQEIRTSFQKEMEKLRADKTIGSPLDAEVDFYPDDDINLSLLYRMEDEIKFFFGVSRADVHSFYKKPEDAIEMSISGIWVVIKLSEHPKCVRCWHRCPEIVINKKYPGLCYRCTDNISEGLGEARKYC